MGWNKDEDQGVDLANGPKDQKEEEGFEIEHDIERLKRRQDKIRKSIAEILKPVKALKTLKTQVDDTTTERSHQFLPSVVKSSRSILSSENSINVQSILERKAIPRYIPLTSQRLKEMDG